MNDRNRRDRRRTRIQKIRTSLMLDHWTLSRLTPVIRKDQAEADRRGQTILTMIREKMATRRGRANSMDVYLVVQRRPLSEKPMVWRWLARLVYFAIGWSSDYGVEYQGVYVEESAARHAASGDGWSYHCLPLNGCLPCETMQYGVHDFPLSDASASYRRRALPFVAVPMKDLQNLVLLENKLDDLHDRLDSKSLKPS